MPMYELTLEQSYAGQQCINRWNAVSDAIPAGVLGAYKMAVAYGFAPDTDVTPFGEGTIGKLIKDLQVTSVIFVQVVVKNIFDPTDYYTYAFPANTTGNTASSDPMSPTAAYGFSTNRTRADVKRGQKRFVGVAEANVGGLGVILSSTMAYLQTVGDGMADLSLAPAGAGVITFSPYVFGRLKYHPPGKDTWAYKYYLTPEAQALHNMAITQWVPKNTVRTQVSRQYGRGK